MRRLLPASVVLAVLVTSTGLAPPGPALSGASGGAGPDLPDLLPGGGQAPVDRVVLVGWDGADRSQIKEYVEAGELPHLEWLANQGSIVAIDVVRTTDTKAGWSQILTGYEPERTRVFNNWRYRPIPRGYTVFERLESHFGPEEFVTVAVIGKHNNLGNEPPKLVPSSGKKKPKKSKDQNHEIRIVEQDGRLYESIPGKPYFHAARSMDVFENGYMKDERVGERAIELLEEYRDRPFFFFVHFAEIDHKGHHAGEGSAKQRQAYRSADTWTGRIVEKLVELGIYDGTLVYVTSDHGFDRGLKQHKDAPYVFLATNDPLVARRGLRVDLAPTILERFGLDIDGLSPPLDGHPLTRPYDPPVW